MRLRVELVRASRSHTVEVDPLDAATLTNAKREVCAWLSYACELARSSGTCVGFGVGVHPDGANCAHDPAKGERGVL